MKKIIFLCSVLLVASVFAGPELEKFLRGAQFFKDGKLQEALHEYEGITNRGPVTWYNMGICYYQQKEFIKALVAFKRAQIGAHYAMLKQTQPFINKLEQHFNQPVESQMKKAIRELSSFFSLFWVQLATLIFWWLLIVLLVFQSYSFRRLKVVAGLWFFVCLFLTGMVWWALSGENAIVIRGTQVYIAPNEQLHTVGSVTAGQEVCIKKQEQEWVRIKANTASGWVRADALEPIEVKV